MNKKCCIIIFLVFLVTSHVWSAPLELFGEKLFTRNSATHTLTAGFLYCYSYEMLQHAGGLDKHKSSMVSFSITNVIGLLKEIFDEKEPGNKFSYKDLLCNLAGSAMMYALWR